jgi:threonylcarbamoyladenosine tRNA methylthiotransferase MtaB
MIIKVLGCKVNFADAQAAASRLTATGPDVESALVGTCCVTAEGEKQSRKEVRRALRRIGEQGTVYVTGCAARRSPESFISLGRNVTVIGEETAVAGPDRRTQNGEQQERRRFFLKIQDGCANGCSYCVIPQVRGVPRSLSQEEILAAGEAAVSAGYPELVITGINLGMWRDGEARLPQLIEKLAGIEGLGRLRLSSIEINHVSPELLGVITGQPVIGRHLHLPVQSGDDGVLAVMGRRYSAADFGQRIKIIREALPEMNLTTDVIVGFPTENEAAFDATLAVVEACGFTKAHVFSYSPRPDTKAAALGDPVPAREKKRRSAALRDLSDRLLGEHRRRKVGLTSEILLETAREDGLHAGYSSDYTRFLVEGGAPGEMVKVSGISVTEAGVRGKLVGAGPLSQ